MILLHRCQTRKKPKGLEMESSIIKHNISGKVMMAQKILNLIPVVLFIMWVRQPVEETHEYINSHVKGRKILFIVKEFLLSVDKDPALYSSLGLTSSLAYSTSCILEIYGAYMCKEAFLLPFVILTLAMDVACIGLHVVAMMLVKENSQDLGLLIGATLLGAFTLMFMFYCTACVFSLWQVLREPVLRELAEDTIGILPGQVGVGQSPNTAISVRSQQLPNLRDDLRYTRRSPFHSPNTFTQYHLGRGTGQRGAYHRQDDFATRRMIYTSRPVPGLSYPSGHSYGALIAPIY